MANKGKVYLKINNLKESINYNSLSGSKANLFQYCQNNTEIHEDTKFKVFKELIKKGFEIFVEPEFKNCLGRPDIIAFSSEGNGYIFEIIQSESQESINKKMLKYPIDFEIILIKCSEPLLEQIAV